MNGPESEAGEAAEYEYIGMFLMNARAQLDAQNGAAGSDAVRETVVFIISKRFSFFSRMFLFARGMKT